MDKKELRMKRQAILRQIDRYEYQRCAKCAGNMSNSSQMLCKCHAAKKIRKLGEEYNGLTLVGKKKRIDGLKAELQSNGLSTELYTQLREAEVSIKVIQKLAGFTQKQMADWRSEHNLMKFKRSESEPAVIRVQKAGLTVEGYKSDRRSGLLDKDIYVKYGINETALYKFKKQHGLSLGRGMHTRKDYAVGRN